MATPLLPAPMPRDPSDWAGWWRPYVHPVPLLALGLLVWLYAAGHGSWEVSSLFLLVWLVVVALLPVNLVVAVVVVLVLGPPSALLPNAAPRAFHTDVPPDERAAFYRTRYEHRFVALAAAQGAALLIGLGTGHAPRSFADRYRRLKIERNERRRRLPPLQLDEHLVIGPDPPTSSRPPTTSDGDDLGPYGRGPPRS